MSKVLLLTISAAHSGFACGYLLNFEPNFFGIFFLLNVLLEVPIYMFGGQKNVPQLLSAPFFHLKNVKFGFYKVIFKSEESWFAPKRTNLRIFLYCFIISRDYM